MSDIAIKVEGLKKQYRLGAIGGGTLTRDLQSWWARKKKKDDPNVNIDVDQSTFGQSFYALNGINLEVKKGEALGIIGGNGAGKSTFLKVLSRVTAPTEGWIGINGRINGMLEVGTGFHPELTGRENIYMNGAILGMARAEVDRKIDEIIEFSECAKFIDTPVKRYSSGMYVKLGFAVAAHLESEIMIMDEVLAVGDMKFQEKCLNTMNSSLNNEGKTILYVSHNMATVKKLCTRCIVLDHGTVAFDGDVDKAIEIYLDRDEAKSLARYELGESKRTMGKHDQKVAIQSFEFLNGNGGMFENEDKMQFRMEWDSFVSDEEMNMMLTLKYADATPVGLAQAFHFPNKGANTSNSAKFEMDISNLAEGKYYLNLNFHGMNTYGARETYDEPTRNIYFEIVRNRESGILWNRRAWGSVRLNEIKVLE